MPSAGSGPPVAQSPGVPVSTAASGPPLDVVPLELEEASTRVAASSSTNVISGTEEHAATLPTKEPPRLVTTKAIQTRRTSLILADRQNVPQATADAPPASGDADTRTRRGALPVPLAGLEGAAAGAGSPFSSM